MWSESEIHCNCQTIDPDRVEKYENRGYKVLIGSFDDYLLWRQRGYREAGLKTITLVNDIRDTYDFLAGFDVDLTDEEKARLEFNKYQNQEQEEIDSILQLFDQ